jgi:hypothetical protein
MEGKRDYGLPTAQQVVEDPLLQDAVRRLLIEVKKYGIYFVSDGGNGIRMVEKDVRRPARLATDRQQHQGSRS